MPKKYLVGNSENTWPLELAYQRAEDGDIIVLEPGFSYSPANTNQNFNDVLFIDKNLEFIGNITEEDSVINFSNIIASKIVIINGVRVKFSNIYFKLDRADHNFYVSEHSKLELSCVVIENTSESNEHYRGGSEPLRQSDLGKCRFKSTYSFYTFISRDKKCKVKCWYFGTVQYSP